ncbi:MAG: hypothetical protein KGO93_08730 [Cyanobacteria bacterium REEB446]|nr:hypothetical protein [Cyanobacteria bacterium REEB446]
MNTLSLGQTAQTISNAITPKAITDGLWSWSTSGLKAVKDTVSVVAPKLLNTNNSKFWGLGIKGAGLALAGAATVSLLSNVSTATKNFSGAIGYDTGSAALVKGGLDILTGASALGMAFGKVNAIPTLVSLAASGIFKEYEKLATNQSNLLKIPAMYQLLTYQANESGPYVVGTNKFSPSYDFFIEADNKIRKSMGFNDYLLRSTYASNVELQRKASTSLTNPRATSLGTL